MFIIRKLLRTVDFLSEKAGRRREMVCSFSWCLQAPTRRFPGTFSTLRLYGLTIPSVWPGGQSIFWAHPSIIFTMRIPGVDLIYTRLSDRGRALLNVICSLIFFFPLMTVMLVVATQWAIKAWRINEVMFNSFWYPPAGPYRSVFAIGLFLLVLQGVANFIRDLYMVIRA